LALTARSERTNQTSHATWIPMKRPKASCVKVRARWGEARSLQAGQDDLHSGREDDGQDAARGAPREEGQSKTRCR
jgi:hypothetical protein